MQANPYKVSGLDYVSDYQYWDFVETVGLNYLEGCAVECVSSWRKSRTALDDLKKALHYLNGLEELTKELRPVRNTVLTPVETWEEVRRFALANNLSDTECRFLRLLSTWRDVEELDDARQALFVLFDEVAVS